MQINKKSKEVFCLYETNRLEKIKKTHLYKKEDVMVTTHLVMAIVKCYALGHKMLWSNY